jgi:hypothetical protein
VVRGDQSCHHYDICGGLDWLETSDVEIKQAQHFAAVSLADGKISEKDLRGEYTTDAKSKNYV